MIRSYVFSLLVLVGYSSFTCAGLWDLIFGSSNNTQSQQAHHTNHKDLLTVRQATSYIENIIASLDYGLRPHTQAHELITLKKNLIQALPNMPHAAYSSISGKLYKKDVIDQYIQSGIIELVEKNSYDYAYFLTRNNSIACKIAERIRNTLMAVIAHHNTLDPEQLIPFFGERLKVTVRELSHQFDTPYQPYYPSPTYSQATPSAPPIDEEIQTPGNYDTALYPSDECVICTDELTPRTRIFMHPCGHDMCKACAREYFIINKKLTCPTCRTTIDKEKLKQDLKP